MSSNDQEKTVTHDDKPVDAESSRAEDGEIVHTLIEPKEEKKLLAKLDAFLVPIIMLVELAHQSKGADKLITRDRFIYRASWTGRTLVLLP